MLRNLYIEHLLMDIRNMIKFCESRDETFIVIFFKNAGFFEDILGVEIVKTNRFDDIIAYVKVSDITEKGLIRLKEYRDYLIITNGV